MSLQLPLDAHMGAATFKVAHLARASTFYGDVLGFTLTHSPGMIHVAPAPGAAPILHLREVPGAVRKPERSIGLYHVAILLSSRAALGNTIQRLMQSGYPVQGASDHLVSEALYLADPDGNGLEMYRDRPRDEWAVDKDGVAMATQPMDIDGVLAAADGTAVAGIDPLATIGHVHLHVRDLATAEKFYVELLGFDVMQRSYPGALFVAAGGYHHHLGLNVWGGKLSPPPNAVGLESFTVVIPGGMEAVAGRLAASGMTVERADGTVSVRDMDGNIVLLVG